MMDIELFCKVNHKNELKFGRKYILKLTHGNDHIYVKNDQDMHEKYSISWFQSVPIQVDERDFFDRVYVDSELVNKVEKKEEILKFL